MARAHLHLDRSLPLSAQSHKGHNRWHPDIPAALRVAPGTEVEIECLDPLDGQIKPGMTAADLATLQSSRVHALAGPVAVEGAEPGDLLAIRIQEISTIDRGFTVISPGFGFLRHHFPKPFLVHWEMANGFAHSAQIPGVKIPGAPFMGVMGLAPSQALFDRISAREADLLARGGMVMPPNADGAVPADPQIARTALRTVPPREVGGNMDIKQLVAGSTLYLPVYQKDALFSVGDGHFAQGDGESCGTAIETASTFVARFELLKGEAKRRGQTDPSFSNDGARPSPALAARPFYATTGNSVRKDGRNESENLNVAAENAILNMIDYLVTTRGLTPEQAYCLISVAVDLRISQAVDVPNVIVSAFLPTDIFEE